MKPHSDKTDDNTAQKSLNVENTVSLRNRLNASVKRSFVGRKFESVKLVKAAWWGDSAAATSEREQRTVYFLAA